ncbi:MAG: hypothetical protein M3Y57_12805 [Acidobacteriota bacterium]|nr:hypothetical protein [Acidobacteriota bacterium]
MSSTEKHAEALGLKYAWFGSVATFKKSAGAGQLDTHSVSLNGQPEQISNEPDLTPNIISPHLSNLPLPDHVYRLIALNRSPGRVEFPETLLGVDPAFPAAAASVWLHRMRLTCRTSDGLFHSSTARLGTPLSIPLLADSRRS